MVGEFYKRLIVGGPDLIKMSRFYEAVKETIREAAEEFPAWRQFRYLSPDEAAYAYSSACEEWFKKWLELPTRRSEGSCLSI